MPRIMADDRSAEGQGIGSLNLPKEFGFTVEVLRVGRRSLLVGSIPPAENTVCAEMDEPSAPG